MRRLVKHGIAGVGFAALTVTTAVAALGSPAGQDLALAVPAPVTSVAPYSTPSPSASDLVVAAEAAARGERTSRDAARAQLLAAARQQAVARAGTLGAQSDSIAAQQTKIKNDQAKAKVAAEARAAEKAKAKAKARAKAKAAAAKARAAKARAIKNRGYEPGTTNPRSMAKQILANKYGYGPEQYSCFNYIIMRESMWDVNAENPSSGAYGIPQALPGSKMASVGSDWRTNPATQIIWGIGYMKSRYGSPCQAKVFKASHGWY